MNYCLGQLMKKCYLEHSRRKQIQNGSFAAILIGQNFVMHFVFTYLKNN